MKFRSFLRFHNEWFLLLSPAFLAVRGYVRFSSSIHWYDALFLFVEYSIWSVLIALLFTFFLPFRRAALLSCLLVLFNAVYSIIYEFAERQQYQPIYTRYSFVASIAALLFLLCFFYLKRTGRKFSQVTNYLNLLFLVLIFVEVGQFTISLIKKQDEIVKTVACKQCPNPDVYLIITDGYAGKKQLKEQFGFDNTPFEDSLRLLGFHVLDSTISNYSTTNISMSSLLKMNYVEVEEDGDIHDRFNPNGVTTFFKKQGYQFVNNSLFQIDGQFPKQTTTFFKTGPLLLTQHSFVAHSMYVAHNLLASLGYAGEKKRIKHIQGLTRTNNLELDSLKMKRLIDLVKSNDGQPKFVYTHFLMPHAPYLFDEQGRHLQDTGTHSAKYKTFLRYTNKQLIYAVKSVLQLSKKPPIILLLSDHGSRIDEWTALGHLRFYNLAAVYLPDKAYGVYYKGMSNVNQFRVLLNQQFRQQLPLLPDTTVH